MIADLFDVEKAVEMPDKSKVSGICLLVNCSKQPTKNGSNFFAGVLSTEKGQVSYKAWSNSAAFVLLDSGDMSGKVVYVAGAVSEYQGTKSVILDTVRRIEPERLKAMGVSERDFMFGKYDSDYYWNAFNAVVKKNVSENAYKCFQGLLNGYEDDFKSEFAAITHHDNCKGGLLAHSFKVCSLAVVIKLYPEVLKRIGKDLLYVGCALHDIGKLDEYSNGAMSESGKRVSHMFCGGARVMENKDLVVGLMGEQFYYDLISIMVGHHGKFGDPPRTVAAYVVHKLDLLDSVFTSLNELLEKNTGSVQYEGFILL